MRFVIVVLAGVLTVFSAQAADWFKISQAQNDAETFFDVDTFQLSNNREGTKVAVILSKMVLNQKVDLSKRYVTLDDCDQGYGKIWVLNLDGNVRFASEWAKGAGTVAATQAEFLCDAAVAVKKATIKKGV